jgi:hypothetical protein
VSPTSLQTFIASHPAAALFFFFIVIVNIRRVGLIIARALFFLYDRTV